MASEDAISWLEEPAEGDYDAAASFLSMLIPQPALAVVTADLRLAPNGHWAAKDILRAAGLRPLKPKQSTEVAEQLKKVNSGRPISPVLLIGGLREYLVIADGYHRVSAAFRLDQATQVPGRLLWLS